MRVPGTGSSGSQGWNHTPGARPADSPRQRPGLCAKAAAASLLPGLLQRPCQEGTACRPMRSGQPGCPSSDYLGVCVCRSMIPSALWAMASRPVQGRSRQVGRQRQTPNSVGTLASDQLKILFSRPRHKFTCHHCVLTEGKIQWKIRSRVTMPRV